MLIFSALNFSILLRFKKENGHDNAMASCFLQSCHDHAHAAFAFGEAEFAFNLNTLAFVTVILFFINLSVFFAVCRESVSEVECYAFCKTSNFHGHDKFYLLEHTRDNVRYVFGIL